MHIQNFSVLVTPYLLLCVPSEQQLQLSVINMDITLLVVYTQDHAWSGQPSSIMKSSIEFQWVSLNPKAFVYLYI